MAEASGSAPDSPAGHSGALSVYTKQALDDLVSKILDEDSNSYHLNGAANHQIMNCDEFKPNVVNQRFVWIEMVQTNKTTAHTVLDLRNFYCWGSKVGV